MNLIIGLGNPGDEYVNTRHNAGFFVADKLASALNFTGWSFNKKFNADITDRQPIGIIVKPRSFMNESGSVVKKLVNFYKINIGDVWIIHDDLDIRLGQYKIEVGHGPQLHNGVNSIEKALGAESFTRVRIGIDNRESDNRADGERYVLQEFTKDEIILLGKATDKAVDEICKRLVM